MSIIGGLDIHRKQLTFDYIETETGRVERGRIAPADRERLADWLTRFDTGTPVAFALEGCTGWRYVVEEMGKAGVRPHLAEPADTAALRGPKRHAKTDQLTELSGGFSSSRAWWAGSVVTVPARDDRRGYAAGSGSSGRAGMWVAGGGWGSV